jgi:hypothetical protein
MFLRTRSDGRSVLSQLQRALPSGALSPQATQCRALSSAATSARLRPGPRHDLQRCPPRRQLRVLQTAAHPQGAHYPRTAALPLNWASTVHRLRHISPSTMTATTQTRSHAGHSHHHHHHDNSFLLSRNKSDAGVRITRIGLYVNLGMAVSKGFGGYVFNSQGESSICARGMKPANHVQRSSRMPSTA